MKMQKLVWVFAAVAACSESGGPPNGGNTVAVRDFLFAPGAIPVAAGATVTWTWEGSAPHNVTFEDGQGSSTTITSGTHDRRFGTAGTFRYRCTLHSPDFNSGMIGSVQVQ